MCLQAQMTHVLNRVSAGSGWPARDVDRHALLRERLSVLISRREGDHVRALPAPGPTGHVHRRFLMRAICVTVEHAVHYATVYLPIHAVGGQDHVLDTCFERLGPRKCGSIS